LQNLQLFRPAPGEEEAEEEEKEEEEKKKKKKKKERRVIVYEDFVNDHDTENEKVSNLVFTIIWRDHNNNIQRKYVDNVCTDETKCCDAFFVRHVWEYHLNNRKDPTSEFYRVTHILRSGDSGPHFHNRLTIEWESNVQDTYDIEWETHTLCKRHAYGLCDAAGGGTALALSGLSMCSCETTGKTPRRYW
jgi:hypothetical protein